LPGFITFFTGTVAATMISAKTGQIGDIRTVISRHIKVCTYESLVPEITSKYPGIDLVGLGSPAKCFAEMDAGTCAVVIVSDKDGDFHLRKPEHCNKIEVGRSLLSYPVSVPVAAEFQAVLSWAVMQGVSAGKYETSEYEAKRKFLPVTSCTRGKIVLEDYAGQLDVADLAGPLLISVISSFIGVAMFFMREVEHELEPVVENAVKSSAFTHAMENAVGANSELVDELASVAVRYKQLDDTLAQLKAIIDTTRAGEDGIGSFFEGCDQTKDLRIRRLVHPRDDQEIRPMDSVTKPVIPAGGLENALGDRCDVRRSTASINIKAQSVDF
jgi:hypothetical protein